MFPNNNKLFLISLALRSPTVGVCKNCGVHRSDTASTATGLHCDYCGKDEVVGSRVINRLLQQRVGG